MVLCCAGPLLLGGGTISGLGAALHNPWLVIVGAVVILVSVIHVLRCRIRRRHGAGPDDCCPSASLSPRPGQVDKRAGRTGE